LTAIDAMATKMELRAMKNKSTTILFKVHWRKAKTPQNVTQNPEDRSVFTKGADIWSPATSYDRITLFSDFVRRSREIFIHEYDEGGVERYPSYASDTNGNFCFDVFVKL
jgi:hypothetical protein